jgi:hypothetical protein
MEPTTAPAPAVDDDQADELEATELEQAIGAAEVALDELGKTDDTNVSNLRDATRRLIDAAAAFAAATAAADELAEQTATTAAGVEAAAAPTAEEQNAAAAATTVAL